MKKIICTFLLIPAFVCGCSTKHYLGKFSLHSDKQDKYLQSSDHSTIDADGMHDYDKPNPVTFTINDSSKDPNYDIYYSYKYRFDDEFIERDHHIHTNSKDVSITNLELGKTYYYKVTMKEHEIEHGTFDTNPGVIRNLEIDGMKNARDMGGYKTSLGYFKPNMIFRTSELNNSKMDGGNDSYITDKGADTMIDELKIKTEIDLRMINEDIPEQYKSESILKVKYGADVKLLQLNIDYNGLNILSETERPKFQQFFATLSNIDNYPICFHCHIGTDRTGMLAAAIHSLLGANIEHIYYDYMFSNFANIGGKREESGINNSYLNIVKDYTGESLADKAYNLLHEQLDIPNRVLDSIRNILLEK